MVVVCSSSVAAPSQLNGLLKALHTERVERNLQRGIRTQALSTAPSSEMGGSSSSSIPLGRASSGGDSTSSDSKEASAAVQSRELIDVSAVLADISAVLMEDEVSEVSEDFSQDDDDLVGNALDDAFIVESDEEDDWRAADSFFADLDGNGEALFRDDMSMIHPESEADSLGDSFNNGALDIDWDGDDSDGEEEVLSGDCSLQTHLVTREDVLERDEAFMCAVCMEDFVEGDTLRILPCSHRFHQACVDRWLCRRRACPMCRCRVGHVAADNNSHA